MAEQYMDLPSQPDVYLVIPPYVPTSRFGLNNQIIEDELQKLSQLSETNLVYQLLTFTL